MKRLWLLALIAGAAAAQPRYLPFRMLSTQASPFRYYVDSRLSAPGNLALNLTQTVTDTAWGTWNNVTCAMPKAASQGLTAGVVVNPEDRFDVYSVSPVWASSSSSAITLDLFVGGFVAAVATPEAYAGVLQTCDIFFNNLNPRFSAVPTGVVPPETLDYQSVMLHEAGHCLGLDHFGFGVMLGNILFEQNKRSLTAEDAQALCGRNPATGQVGAPCTGAGTCNAGLNCVSGAGSQGPSMYCASPCTPNTTACPLPMQCLPAAGFPGTMNACQYPPSSTTQVGRFCSTQAECGSLVGTCLRETRAATDTILWKDGYCTQSCEAGQPACPGGTVCLPSTDGSQRLCVNSCRVGLADCRPGYACDTLSASSGNEGICVPACRVEGDCFDPIVNGQRVDYECRVCDGRCVPKQNSGSPIGAICTMSSQCGVGQICRPADVRLPTQQCTTGCGRGCGTCPTGSACIADDRGELFCLKTCSGKGSCGLGLRCRTFPGVQACVPMCQFDLDCPVGQRCIEGECELPVDPEDAGCTVFCSAPDAGMPFRPRPDGGTPSGGGSAGCACSTPGAFSPMLGLVGLALAARRRRR
jgi:MYXO-CTERM domain-containing protein